MTNENEKPCKQTIIFNVYQDLLAIRDRYEKEDEEEPEGDYPCEDENQDSEEEAANE